MNQWLTNLVGVFRNDHLTGFWWLLVGYVLCYAVAFILARGLISASSTILHTCRKAWVVSFLLHALASSGVIVNWYFQNSMISSFWRFFPFYLTPLIVDLCLAFGLFASLQRYVQYHEKPALSL